MSRRAFPFRSTACELVFDVDDARAPAIRAALRRLGASTAQVGERTVDTVQISGATARIDLTFDTRFGPAGGRPALEGRLHYRLVDGDPHALVEFARAGVEAHGIRLKSLSGGIPGDRTPHAGMRGPELFAIVVRGCLEPVLANSSEVARGLLDDEVIHELRVGLRRTKTASRELGDACGQHGRRDGQVARDAVFHSLGALRDRTISDALRARLTGSEPERSDDRESVDEARSIVHAVRGKPFQSALLDIVGAMLVAADRAAAKGGAAPKVIRWRIADRLQALRRGVRDDAREFSHLDAAARHAARKRVKRLRYLVDLVGPVYGARRAKAYSAVLGEAQQVLGTYLDLVTALRALGPAIADTDLSSRAGLERMRKEAAVALKRCKAPLRRAAAARAFWR